MKSITRTAPTYLVRTPYSYCFRYSIPKDLHSIVGKKEIRYSLKTGYIGKAKTMSFQLAAKVQNLCAELREIIGDQTGSTIIAMPKELSPERIQELIVEWVGESLKEDEQERLRPPKRLTELKIADKYSGYLVRFPGGHFVHLVPQAAVLRLQALTLLCPCQQLEDVQACRVRF